MVLLLAVSRGGGVGALLLLLPLPAPPPPPLALPLLEAGGRRLAAEVEPSLLPRDDTLLERDSYRQAGGQAGRRSEGWRRLLLAVCLLGELSLGRVVGGGWHLAASSQGYGGGGLGVPPAAVLEGREGPDKTTSRADERQRGVRGQAGRQPSLG